MSKAEAIASAVFQAPSVPPVRIGFVPTHRFSQTPWCAKMLADSLQALRSVPGVEVVAPRPAADGKTIDPSTGTIGQGSIVTIDQAQALAAYFSTQRLDGLVVCPLDFGDERSACTVAQQVGLPVLLYATKEPPAGTDPSLQRLSDSYCGNLALAAGLHRRKLPFRYAGLFFPDEPQLAQEFADFAAALAIIRGLKNARIGQIGHRPPTFESVAYDEIAMARKFAQMVIPTSFSDMLDVATALPDDAPDVRAILADVRRTVPTITVAEDYVLKAAKLEAAIAGFFRQHKLSGLAVQCWPQKSGIQLCSVLGRLTGRGIHASCETDVLGTVSMIVSHRSTLGRSLPHLIDWTIQHRDDPNLTLAWHCGNAPPCLARDAREVALRSRRDMTGALPPQRADGSAGLLQFQLTPGPVTICRLAEYDGQWRLLIVGGEIVPSTETLAGTWSWVRLADHARLYRTLVEEGFIHHASMIHGDQRKSLELACKFLDIRPVTA